MSVTSTILSERAIDSWDYYYKGALTGFHCVYGQTLRRSNIFAVWTGQNSCIPFYHD